DTTTRGGPAVLIEPYRNGWWWIQSDSRKRFVWYQEFDFGKSLGPAIWYRGTSGTLSFRPSSAVQSSVGFDVNENRDFWQWVDRVTDPDGTTHEVFADLHTHILDLTVRTDVTFSPNLSLQLYM